MPTGLGNDLFGDELGVPALWPGPTGIALSVCPVRIVQRSQNPVSFVVWGDPVWRIGKASDLNPEQEQDLRQLPARVDYGAALSLWVLSETEPSQAPWAYRYEVASSVEESVSRAAELLVRWNRGLLSQPTRADLDLGLRQLEELRRSLPIMRLAVAIHGEDAEPAPKRLTPGPMTTTGFASGTQAIAARVRRDTRELDTEILESVALLSQVTASMRLQIAEEERHRQQRFRTVITLLGALAVLPGLLAAWVQASHLHVGPLPLAGLMIGAGLLSLGLFALNRWIHHD